MIDTRKPDQTRRLLLEAAFAEMYRNGFQAAGINSILARTGVTKGALYHHFTDKNALGYAVVEEVIGRMVRDYWIAPLSQTDDPVACLLGQLEKAGGKSCEDIQLGCPLCNLAAEMSSVDEGFRTRVAAVYAEWCGGLAEALRRGQRAGTVRKAVDPEQAATFIVASLAGARSLTKNFRSAETYQACMDGLREYLTALTD